MLLTKSSESKSAASFAFNLNISGDFVALKKDVASADNEALPLFFNVTLHTEWSFLSNFVPGTGRPVAFMLRALAGLDRC